MYVPDGVLQLDVGKLHIVSDSLWIPTLHRMKTACSSCCIIDDWQLDCLYGFILVASLFLLEYRLFNDVLNHGCLLHMSRVPLGLVLVDLIRSS